ncbi:hypothetical protein [Nitrosopumilus sp.]|uniref:hypothetical protein n=1 Tax=Nitrosopumilus sp. TaxID=2024843 RepID=UPI00247BE48E|nr:hypothetical protein [Nitrosopumilus sp.]MCV0430632.1 hypothetical protein [Nitrosopumilus sp.]
MLQFLLLTLLLFPAFGQSAPDYDNPYSPIFTDKPVYSWTDKMKITIISPSWNSDRHLIDSIGDTNDHPIKISTSENSLEPYRFTETDVNSGIFTAEVILTGFTHDVDGDGNFDTSPRTIGNGPTSGFLEVDRDSAITISFEFADGVVLVESVPVSWNVGTINFMKDVFFLEDAVIVRVVDADMNLNPEALDNLPVQVFSDSDVAGIEVNAVETSESSGLFVATIPLSQNSPSSGNRLYAMAGDDIFAKYDDYTLPKPYSITDNLEIKTSAKVDSSIPSIERIQNSEITFSDGFGNPIQSYTKNSQIQIVGTVANNHDLKQQFVYFFQVKNDKNFVESLSWIQGEISSQQILDVSQSWIPDESGTYEIETFVWNSINNPTALSPKMSTLITVE